MSAPGERQRHASLGSVGSTSAEEWLAATPIAELHGVGSRMAARLARLGIHTVQDALFHLPSRYQDRTRVQPIGSLRTGDEVVIVGEITHTRLRYGRRRSLLSTVRDGTGSITLRFFHFSAAQQAGLETGRRVRCYGEARRGTSSLEMVHPEYRLMEPGETPVLDSTLTPVYPTTEGLHQLRLRRITDQALELLDRQPPAELLPEPLLETLGLPTLLDALRVVHRPPPETSSRELAVGTHPAQQRLAFEELLAHHLSLRMLRSRVQSHSAPALRSGGHLRQRLLDSLPFRLTGAQHRVGEEVGADLGKPCPMQRLIQGDVGSGKTVVAALAALQAIEAGYQVAVMAPTELLAEQHLRTFSQWFEPLAVPVLWLSGRLGPRQRRMQLARIREAGASLVVGTHALFQQEVAFARLALVIIDEQHRFGVHQRLALRDKGQRDGNHPHQLIMTATPIPRTLTMTVYADLDTSVIDQLPPGREPVETVVVPDSRREEVIERLRTACAAGRQAYWVCTLIDESEALQAQAASETAARLRETLPEQVVGLVHGRMKPGEKEATMDAFKSGSINLLVATTVVEVGVDVPRASLMVIENAERLGLAQLHQLRGRVGRGVDKSSCLLMYHGPLTKQARARLAVLRDSNDGFAIAQRDLELRGPGEVLGTRQTGMLQFRIADLSRDRSLFPAVEKVAGALLAHHRQRVMPLVNRWIGNGLNYETV